VHLFKKLKVKVETKNVYGKSEKMAIVDSRGYVLIKHEQIYRYSYS